MPYNGTHFYVPNTMKIVSTTGIWVKNEAVFPMTDGENGTRYEPGEVMKVEETEWLKAQPCIKRIDDPLAAKPVVKSAK